MLLCNIKLNVKYIYFFLLLVEIKENTKEDVRTDFSSKQFDNPRFCDAQFKRSIESQCGHDIYGLKLGKFKCIGYLIYLNIAYLQTVRCRHCYVSKMSNPHNLHT